MDYDFIVIGAGPAGTSFCKNISKDYSVLLIDKRGLDLDLNFLNSKACGGLLNLECQRELAVQSLAIPKKVLNEPQMFTVKAFDIDNNVSNHYQKSYMNIDRTLFDSFMLKECLNKVDFLPNSLYLSHKELKNSVEVKVKIGGKIIKYTTRRLVDASGAASVLSKKTRKQPRSYACIQRHYEFENRLPYMFSIFDNRVSDYYSWGIQKEDTLIVGSAIDDKYKAKEKFDLLLDDLHELGFVLGDEIKREGALLVRPKHMSEVFIGTKLVHSIGEAAGLISPSSSEGISFALRSGRYLAEVVNNSYLNYRNEYAKSVSKLKKSMFIKEKKSRLMYGKTSRKLIIKMGVLSTKVAEERKKYF